MLPFRDRGEAGRALAASLGHYTDQPNVIVLALPRGGVPVGFELARYLHTPLDVLIVRKLGVPGHEELALGAIASGGIRLVNESLIRELSLSTTVIDALVARELAELERREREFRSNRTAIRVEGCTVILADDGLATGATMLAACKSVRARRPARVVVAVPVAPKNARIGFLREADEFVCLASPEPFESVGMWYSDFRQTSDAEVRELLGQSK